MTRLPLTRPFEFRHTLAFLNAFPPAAHEQSTRGELRKATRLNGQTVGFTVREDTEGLTCTLHPEAPLKPEEEAALLERVAFFLGTRDDLWPFYALAERDEVFRPVLNELRGFHQPKFLTPFEAACWAVIGQRLPLPQARKVKLALMVRSGGEWKGLPAFPEPADLAHLTEAEILELLPNQRKARALVEATRAFGGVTTAELVNRPHEEVRGWLRGIYGVGEWSALFILVRGLGRLENVRPKAGESPFLKELLKAARPVYGGLTPDELWRIAESYGDQQGQWAIYLRSRSALTPGGARAA
ncbi:DNA-3-methyladenine glycosylase family protein [Deinococcus apachensis]|uniref:DNA-3-methyladenine glycosylase family protein n=1 Tax=Deinococcus apachensis TaxID=309886 RepID=UPI0003656424|nr:hypothetical protein [Deinococcus apachensis]